MNRNSLIEMSGRVMHQAVRMTLSKSSDKPMMQESDFTGMLGDARKLVERVQAYGLSSVPLPPIVKKALGAAGGGAKKSNLPEIALLASDSGGGGAGAAQEDSGATAEGIGLFLGGQRNHPTVIALDDRRHRPMGMKPGENAQYDDIQQMTLMRRNGLYLLSNDNEDGEGKKAERMVSLRHVEKDKQKRGQVGQQGERPQQEQGGQGEDFKHEGKTVNTELRVTKNKIEFRNGETVKAEHNKDSDKWDFKGKEHHVTSSDKHTVTTKNVAINGSTGVGITGPTTINGSPAMTLVSLGPLLATIDALQARVAALEAR